ncbi:MAG: hypothetical protein ACF8CY_04415, partial [Gimesia chilikensis]
MSEIRRFLNLALAITVCLGCLSTWFPWELPAQKTNSKKVAVKPKQSMPAPKPPHWPETAVYLPLDQLDALMSRDRSGVLLPRAQYESLKKQAEANTGGTGLPDTRSVIYGAAYEATLSD